ncbi:hypothetical protein [Streptomyces nanshensis]|uniref:OB domain-containing protein n=1 Tax=Streptomyces nanshensis TaxID=518642 RepID=A0A1E7L205_9ACTN|nr:hypothetical protein [Streptomyces nanshensis]OEV10220.1 hypothetical protein AN218_18550 [Streptomyces nanshensis]
MTTATASGFPFTTRRTTTSLGNVTDDTWGFATATITTATPRGTGNSRRMTLGLTADNGATAVATLDSVRLRQTPDFLLTPGARVQVRGVVRRLTDTLPVIDVIGIAPA